MTRTYLVSLPDQDNETPDAVAADIQDSLESDGFLVESVKPWASPLSSSSELDPLSLPTLGA